MHIRPERQCAPHIPQGALCPLFAFWRNMDDLSKPNLLPYGIIPSAPAIQLPNVDLFRKNKSQSVSHYFQSRFDELKRHYEEMLNEIYINDIIYRAKYNFVPIVGQVYHLYQNESEYILSLIEPERWNKYTFIGSFRLRSTDVWEKENV